MTLRDWRPSVIESDTVQKNIHEFIVPDQERWHIMSIWAEHTTSATVADRQMCVHVYDSSGALASDEFFQARPGLVQTASLTYFYNFYPGAADLTSVRDTDYVSTPIPATLVLNPGYSLLVEDNSSADTSSDLMEVRVLYQMSRVPSTSIT